MNFQKFVLTLFTAIFSPIIPLNAALTPTHPMRLPFVRSNPMTSINHDPFSPESFAQQGIRLQPADSKLWLDILNDPELKGEQGTNWSQWTVPAIVGAGTTGSIAYNLWKLKKRQDALDQAAIEIQQSQEQPTGLAPHPATAVIVPVATASSQTTTTDQPSSEKTPWWKKRYLIPIVGASGMSGAGIRHYLWKQSQHPTNSLPTTLVNQSPVPSTPAQITMVSQEEQQLLHDMQREIDLNLQSAQAQLQGLQQCIQEHVQKKEHADLLKELKTEQKMITDAVKILTLQAQLATLQPKATSTQSAQTETLIPRLQLRPTTPALTRQLSDIVDSSEVVTTTRSDIATGRPGPYSPSSAPGSARRWTQGDINELRNQGIQVSLGNHNNLVFETPDARQKYYATLRVVDTPEEQLFQQDASTAMTPRPTDARNALSQSSTQYSPRPTQTINTSPQIPLINSTASAARYDALNADQTDDQQPTTISHTAGADLDELIPVHEESPSPRHPTQAPIAQGLITHRPPTSVKATTSPSARPSRRRQTAQPIIHAVPILLEKIKNAPRTSDALREIEGRIQNLRRKIPSHRDTNWQFRVTCREPGAQATIDKYYKESEFKEYIDELQKAFEQLAQETNNPAAFKRSQSQQTSLSKPLTA